MELVDQAHIGSFIYHTFNEPKKCFIYRNVELEVGIGKDRDRDRESEW